MRTDIPADSVSALGFTGAKVFSRSKSAQASAAKMCRSVMIKGIEALLTESLLTARRYGVEDVPCIDSLQNLFPGENWRVLARYMISRSLHPWPDAGRKKCAKSRGRSRSGHSNPHMSAASARASGMGGGVPGCKPRHRSQLDADAGRRPVAEDAPEKSSC